VADNNLQVPRGLSHRREATRILLIVVVVLHAGLAIAIKILFFAHGSPVSDIPAKPSDPMQDAPKGDAGGEGRMFF
jgi:hypothetical protein